MLTMGSLGKILRLAGVPAAALVLGLTLTHVLQAPGEPRAGRRDVADGAAHL